MSTEYDELAVETVVAGTPMTLTHEADAVEALRRLAARGTVTMEGAAELVGRTRHSVDGLCRRNRILWPRDVQPLSWVYGYARGRKTPGADQRAEAERRARALGVTLNTVVRVLRSEGRATYVGTVVSLDDDGPSVRVNMPLSRGYRERWDAPAHYPMDKVLQVPWWRVLDVVRRVAR